MSQPKLTERITRLEDAILEIKTIIEQKDNLGDLIAQLKRSKTVTAPAPVPVVEDATAPVPVVEDAPAPAPVVEDAPAPVPVVEDAPAPVPAPAQVVEDAPVEPTPIEFHAPALPSKPSLVMVLSSLSPSSTSNEQKLIKRFKKYIDDFLEENPTADGVTMDYRLLALTMEFVSAAEKEIKYLTNSKETTRAMSVATVIWLLQAYQEYNNKAALALPANLALLIHTVYDMLLSTQYMIKAPDAPAPTPAPKKSKWGLHWHTLKKRWTQRKEPAQ